MADQQSDKNESIRLSVADAFSTKVNLDFVLPGLLTESTGLIIAPGGTGKSMIALEIGMSVALGRDVFDLFGGEEIRPGDVVYLNVEDSRQLIHSRLHNFGSMFPEQHDIDELEAALHILPAVGMGFRIATKEGGHVVATPQFEQWTKRLKQMEVRPRLVIFDTLNRLSAGLDENNNGEMGQLMSLIDAFNRDVGCASMIVHHASKAAMWSGQGDSQQAGRGASAVTDNARWQMNLMTMPKEMAEQENITEEDRKGWVKMELAKVNAGPPIDARWARRLLGGIMIGREVTPWEMDPAPKKGKGKRTKKHDGDPY